MKAALSLGIAVLFLSGCSIAPQSNLNTQQGPVEPPASSQPTPDSDDNQTKSSPATLKMPPEWNKKEKDIFKGFVLFYPEVSEINLDGKRALMENSYLICQAYEEGYLRREIQAAISGGAFSAAMADDWMALSVTYLCPEYLSIQMSD
jgi:hypothetical protein